jgi:aminoglycoside 6'-N-acetyltransferase I
MPVRPMRDAEVGEVKAMMTELWPDFDGDTGDEQIMVWERDGGGLGGFISFSMRPWAEGCDTRPVPFVEGWWVAPELRRRGVGRALMAAVEAWARMCGFAELGSDVLIDNHGSIAAHGRLGFEPRDRIQYFRKRLR